MSTKGECYFILDDSIKYYTKEVIKLLKVIFIGLLIVIAIIVVKYKPMYEIKVGQKTIGYIKEKNQINNYIESIIDKNENIAFIDLKENVSYNLKLVSRKDNSKESVMTKIENNLDIEYTTCAITYNKENIAYVANMEKAEEIIDNLKEQEKDTSDVGILQVYSDSYEAIKADSLEEAEKKVTTLINENKEEKTVKVAKTNTSKSSIFTVKPISGVITSRYGHRSSPGGIGSTNHKGMDISAKTGIAIKAAATGTVKFAGYKGSLGNLVIIESEKGIETYYGHCSKIYVKKGQKVTAGDKIAAVGQTGAATGPHLHLEIHVNGSVINPQKYLYK